MRRLISGVAVLSACIALSVNPAAYAGSNVLTKVNTENTLEQKTVNKKAEKTAMQLLKDASVENSAMCLWEHNGGTAERQWLFNKDVEQEIVNYINGITLGDAIKDIDAGKLNGVMYGIGIGTKDGTWVQFTWRDGYVFTGDGSVYKADIDFGRIKNYSWQDKDQMPLYAFPNMYYIAIIDGKWDTDFLEESKKLKPGGLKVTTKKFNGTKLSVKLKNKTKKELCYGEYFSIQAKIDGKWYTVPAKEEMSFNDIAHIMKAGQSLKRTYDLSAYGKLPSGKYRIVIEGASSVFNII